jgi:tetratricopeptide (TPR) repeat protein
MGPFGRAPAICAVCLVAFSGRAATVESIRSLLQAGRTTEALREMEALQKQNVGNPNVLLELGKIFQELAAARATRLEQLNPESPQVHELIGKSLESHNRVAEALTQYKLAAQKDPKLPGIHFLIGNLYWKEQDLDAALPEMQAELRLNPDHSLANLRMGEILLTTEADHPERALPYLQKAAAGPHASLEAHRERGKALRMAGQYREAMIELQLVAERDSEDSKVHAQLAALYRAMGNPEAAKKEMETLREILQREREASLQAHQEQGRR